MWEQLQQWDRSLFIYLNSLGIEKYDAFWIFVTKIEHWTPLYILFFILFFIVYTRRKAFIGVGITLVVFAVTLGLTEIVKNTVGRLRPNNNTELAELIRVLQTPGNFSFFSGHAAVSFAMTTFVVLALRSRFKWVYVFYIWPLLFIMSRILVGVHYPGDILVGALVGTTIGFYFWKYLGKQVLQKA
ncbi:phosphatase PAP2 family protein [Dokdonia sp. Asnod2-E02]|uniref:phosphatase PAP2 family protein n=1 Tax=Dokdonia sp. Asnod2-E02 TaxID=3160574 RepID=UPI00386396AC